MSRFYTIGVQPKRADVHVATIRYYQRRGPIGEPWRPLGGARHYTSDHARRLRLSARPKG